MPPCRTACKKVTPAEFYIQFEQAILRKERNNKKMKQKEDN